jgi:hypothetical protein
MPNVTNPLRLQLQETIVVRSACCSNDNQSRQLEMAVLRREASETKK